MSESLFPGYLFIQLGPLDNWAPLRSTRGVSRLVAFGNQPLPVSAELIAQLRRRCNASDDEQLFVRGEQVRVVQGPFAELDALFLAMDGNQRVILLINILQREQNVSAPLASIRKAH